MNKSLIYLFISFTVSTSVQAQEITLNKDQFLQMTNQMLNQAEDIQAQIEASTDAQMKQHLSPEEYQEFKAEEKMMQAEESAQFAECLGISENELESVKGKVTPQVIGKAIQNCAAKLPETISMSGADWSSNPELVEFNACTEKEIADKANVSLAKFQRCNSQGEDW